MLLWYIPSSSPQLSPHSVASSSVGYGVVVSSLFKVGTSVSAVGFTSGKNGAGMLFATDRTKSPGRRKQSKKYFSLVLIMAGRDRTRIPWNFHVLQMSAWFELQVNWLFPYGSCFDLELPLDKALLYTYMLLFLLNFLIYTGASNPLSCHYWIREITGRTSFSFVNAYDTLKKHTHTPFPPILPIYKMSRSNPGMTWLPAGPADPPARCSLQKASGFTLRLLTALSKGLRPISLAPTWSVWNNLQAGVRGNLSKKGKDIKISSKRH